MTPGRNFCASSAEMWHLVGLVLLIFKIVIPIILIILGMIDLGKAVVDSDDKAVSKAATTLGKRLVAAVIIFFIPTIIGLVFSLVGQFSSIENDYNVCKECITHPNSSACTSNYQTDDANQ